MKSINSTNTELVSHGISKKRNKSDGDSNRKKNFHSASSNNEVAPRVQQHVSSDVSSFLRAQSGLLSFIYDEDPKFCESLFQKSSVDAKDKDSTTNQLKNSPSSPDAQEDEGLPEIPQLLQTPIDNNFTNQQTGSSDLQFNSKPNHPVAYIQIPIKLNSGTEGLLLRPIASSIVQIKIVPAEKEKIVSGRSGNRGTYKNGKNGISFNSNFLKTLVRFYEATNLERKTFTKQRWLDDAVSNPDRFHLDSIKNYYEKHDTQQGESLGLLISELTEQNVRGEALCDRILKIYADKGLIL